MTKKNADISIKKAIDNLAHKKHVVSEKSQAAKKQLDSDFGSYIPGQRSQLQKNAATVQVFNESVQLLMTIFQKSHFDRLALFISNPSKVLIINFLIGIVQGLGFALGLAIVFFLGLNVMNANLSLDFFQTLLNLS